MGCACSKSNLSKTPIITYSVYYCSLIPIKENIYKIKLISKEEIPQKSGRKFFDQICKNREKEILDFCERENFEQKTLFYLYNKNTPQIKNLYQMMNLMPNHIPNIQKIFLLNIEEVESFPKFFIERKTQNLSHSDFINKEIDLNDMEEILEEMNDINITEDNIIYDDDKLIDDNDNTERNDEIYINGLINEDYINFVKETFLKNLEIIKVYISEIKIEDKKSFAELINFFGNKDIKLFSVYDTNINDSDSIIFYAIIQILEKNTSIRSLDLHNCNLNDFNINELIRAISDKRIHYLDLSKNGLTAEGASIISEYLRINKTLIKLNLCNNNTSLFKTEGINYIINGIIFCPNIKYINFSGMNITGCGEGVGDLINENKNLENIILKNNFLNNNDFKNIFNAIKSSKTLKEIDVSFNDMGGNKVMEYIRDAIKENNSLILLEIDKINVNNDNYSTLFEGIENNKSIRKYSIRYNKINPKIVFEFFVKQTQVKTLRFLSDEKNKDFTFEEKKLIDKCKNERPDLNIIAH